MTKHPENYNEEEVEKLFVSAVENARRLATIIDLHAPSEIIKIELELLTYKLNLLAEKRNQRSN